MTDETLPDGPDPIELLRLVSSWHQSATPEVVESDAERLARAVEGLAGRAGSLDTNELLDAGVSLAAEHTGADGMVLYRNDGDRVRVVRRLRTAWSPRPEELPADWFPWSLGQVSPNRFLFVADCRSLPVGPGASPSLGDLGIRSCVHLPVLERNQPVGSLQLYWTEPQTAWDDAMGPTLRNLGRFLVARATDPHVVLTLD